MKHKLLLTSLIILLIPVLSACHSSTTNTGPTIKTTLTNQDFTSLNVKSLSGDIELRQGDKCKVVYQGGKSVKPQVSFNNGTLTINQKKVAVTHKSKWFLFSFSSKTSTQYEKIIIYLPKEKINKLSINTEDGDINGYGSLSANSVKLNTEDGDITLSQLSAQKGSINSADGDIKITELSSKDGFKVLSEDGDISIKHTDASGYKLSTDDGDLNIRKKDSHVDDDDGRYTYYHNIDSQNVLTVHSEDGDINIE